jgi:hypothetical protein
MREGSAMKRESEVGLFREDGEGSEFMAFRADSEIAREVAFADRVGVRLNPDGLSEIAFCGIEDGQLVKKLCYIRIFGPQRFPNDGQRPLK